MADYLKPVVLKLGKQEYGIDINCVSAIEKFQQVVPVPNSEAFIKGIINLRGEVVPVYNLKKKFNMEESEANAERKLIVVKLSDVVVAFEVDEVSQIEDLEPENITDMPEIVRNDSTLCFERVANVEGRLIVLLDVNHLLSQSELSTAKKLKEDMMQNEDIRQRCGNSNAY